MSRRRSGIPAGEPPAYRPCMYQETDAMLGPAGAEGTFVDVTGPGGETVRALLGRILGRRDGLTAYAVLHHRTVKDESQRDATGGEKQAADKLLSKLVSLGRKEGGVPAGKYISLLRGRISSDDARAIMRALNNELESTRSPRNRMLSRTRHMIHLGRAGRGGRRLSLYATEDGRLYNELTGMRCPDGHRKILDYKLTREIRNIHRYVESLVFSVLAETKGKPEFVEQARPRNPWPPFPDTDAAVQPHRSSP